MPLTPENYCLLEKGMPQEPKRDGVPDHGIPNDRMARQSIINYVQPDSPNFKAQHTCW